MVIDNKVIINSIAMSFVLMICFSVFSAQETLAVGLKVYLTLSHNNNGATQVCVSSAYEDLGCETVTLSGLTSPYTYGPFTFSENVVPVGGEFSACATNLANNQYRCASGTNGVAKAPEYVSLTVPSGVSSGRAAVSNQNLKNLCELVEDALYKTCSEYFYPDGNPTTEGKRGLDCMWGGLTIGLAGLAMEIPLPLVLAGLDFLTGTFNCQGIVRMDSLRSVLGQPGIIEQVRTLLGI